MDGKAINPVHLNLLIYGELDPDMPHIKPEERAQIWESCLPKLEGFKGKAIIMGTSGEIEPNNFKELWNK